MPRDVRRPVDRVRPVGLGESRVTPPPRAPMILPLRSMPLPAVAVLIAAAGCGGGGAAGTKASAEAGGEADFFTGLRSDLFCAAEWVDAVTVAGVSPDRSGTLWNPARLPAIRLTVANLTDRPVEIREPLVPGPRLLISEQRYLTQPFLTADGALDDGSMTSRTQTYGTLPVSLLCLRTASFGRMWPM